jgi:hypothetical protein
MIDNFNIIYPLLTFESEDDFYFLQILQRKKENPELGSNSRVIKNYYIKSVDHLLLRYDEIKMLCDMFNARASIRLNKRSFEKAAFKALSNFANTMQNKSYDHIMKSYDKACGETNNEKTRSWIVDVDSDDNKLLSTIISAIDPCMPEGNKIITVLPSKNGFHIITKPFNVVEFRYNLNKVISPSST